MPEEAVLDASGLLCPLPVLRARKAMQRLAPGDVLKLIATDPGAVRDVDALCEATGNRLLERTETDGAYIFRIEKT